MIITGNEGYSNNQVFLSAIQNRDTNCLRQNLKLELLVLRKDYERYNDKNRFRASGYRITEVNNSSRQYIFFSVLELEDRNADFTLMV